MIGMDISSITIWLAIGSFFAYIVALYYEYRRDYQQVRTYQNYGIFLILAAIFFQLWRG